MSASLTRAFLAAGAIVGMTSPLRAQETPQDWVKECESSMSDRRHCEVREYTLAGTSGVFRINASPNGGIRIMAWDKGEIRVVAKVEAQSKSLADAEAIAQQVKVEAGPGEVRSTGPHDLTGHRNWSVSFDVWMPAATDLQLRTTNGALVVEGVTGALDLETTNGGITIELGGTTWKGGGIEAETTNGGIRLTVPQGLSADLEVETTNGGIDVDFPVQVQGRIGRNLRTRLGEGGPLIHLETTNGGVSIRRK